MDICNFKIIPFFFISYYKSKTSKKYSIKDNMLTNTILSDTQPSFQGGTGFTNMLAVDKDGGVVIETEQVEKQNSEMTVSSGV